jgi:hypothetical protein
MDAASIGIASTTVVGLAGIGAAFFAPTWTNQKAEQRRKRSEFRTARRLVSDELARILAELRAIAQVAQLVEGEPEALLQFSEWVEHKQALSGTLPNDAWKSLSFTYRNVQVTATILARAGAGDLSDEEIEMVKGDAALVEKARAVLDAAEPMFD